MRRRNGFIMVTKKSINSVDRIWDAAEYATLYALSAATRCCWSRNIFHCNGFNFAKEKDVASWRWNAGSWKRFTNVSTSLQMTSILKHHRRRSEMMTSRREARIVEACPRSLIFASPVVRVIQNENRRSEKIVFNVKDEFCKQTKTNESLPKQTKANKTNLWNKRGHEYYIPEKTSTMSSAHTVIAELLI